MLIEQIDQDLKESMKAKDTVKVSTLRMFKAAAKNAAIEKKKPNLDDTECLTLISKLVKQRRESIEEFKKGNRMEMPVKRIFPRIVSFHKVLISIKNSRVPKVSSPFIGLKANMIHEMPIINPFTTETIGHLSPIFRR